MNNITKTGIGILTAGVIAGGSVLVTDIVNSDTAVPEQAVTGIDWSQYDLNLPTLDLPTISLPELTSLEIEEQELIAFKLPDLSETDAELQKINNILNSVNTSIEKDKAILKSMMEFQELLKTSFKVKDIRNLKHDKTISYDNPIIAKWIEIYKNYEEVKPIKFVKCKPFRMITEIIYPNSQYQLDILSKNLKFYKSIGYDSVLLTFDGSENVENLVNLVKYIKKNHELNVWFTYSGEENLSHSIFIDPDKYSAFLQKLAGVCDGYINSWRRTSGHLLEQDEAFKNYTNIMLRLSNENIPIVGELYFGETHKYPGKNRGYALNSSINNSAISIVNFGFYNINIDYIIKNVLKSKVNDYDMVGVVVGSKPYYKEGLETSDYTVFLNDKKRIEDMFINAGCIGTITLQNDGSEHTNNLSEFLYNK